jgi:hypothetical protein
MPRSDRSPSIVPPGNDQDVYLVLDDFRGRIGSAWRETDAEAARLETVIAYLLDGQYSSPVRVIAFNTAEGWLRDVSETWRTRIIIRSHNPLLQCMSPVLAPNGHGAMSELSPLSEAKRKSDLGAVRSALDPLRSFWRLVTWSAADIYDGRTGPTRPSDCVL